MKIWRNGVEIPCNSTLYETLVDHNLLQYGDKLTTKGSFTKNIGDSILYTATNEGKYLCHFIYGDEPEFIVKIDPSFLMFYVILPCAIVLLWIILK